jgi:hypothetical protein
MQKENKSWISALVSWRIISTNHIIFLGVLAHVDYSQYGATTLAAESLRAQLHSQCKLTTLRHENRKIRHENEVLKAKEPTPDV